MSAETAPHQSLTLRVGLLQKMAECGQLPGKTKERHGDSGLGKTGALRELSTPVHAGPASLQREMHSGRASKAIIRVPAPHASLGGSLKPMNTMVGTTMDVILTMWRL